MLHHCTEKQIQEEEGGKESKPGWGLGSEAVKSCCCQGLDSSLQSTLVCDVQDLVQASSVKRNLVRVTLPPSAGQTCEEGIQLVHLRLERRSVFGAVLAAWGMCQSPPWSLSHLKISSPLWGLCNPQQRNIPWLWKPHCLFLRAALASLTCCTSLCLYYLKPEAVGLLGGYGHLPSDCSPHHLVWWCLCRSPGSNNTLLHFWTPIYPKLSSLDPSYFLNSIVFSVWTVLICYI